MRSRIASGDVLHVSKLFPQRMIDRHLSNFADLKQRVGDGVLEKWVQLLVARGQERTHGTAITNPAQGHGREPAKSRVVRSKSVDQGNHRVRVAPESRTVNGCNANLGAAICDSCPNRLPRPGSRDAMQSPGCGQLRLRRDQILDVGFLGERVDGATNDNRPLVRQVTDGRILPIESKTTRIFRGDGFILGDAINRAKDLRLGRF